MSITQDDGLVTLTRVFHFSAAHFLRSPGLSEEENRETYGPCHRLHGHNYLVEVTVGGSPDPLSGMAADLGGLEAAVKRTILDLVDHGALDADVPALSGVITTGENLARVFWRILQAELPPGSLKRVAVVETANNMFEYCGEAAEGAER